MEKRSR